MFTSVFQDRYFLFYPLTLANNHTPPNSWKLYAITHVLLFQTALKMTSRRCIVAKAVSSKKAIVYYFSSIAYILGILKSVNFHCPQWPITWAKLAWIFKERSLQWFFIGVQLYIHKNTWLQLKEREEELYRTNVFWKFKVLNLAIKDDLDISTRSSTFMLSATFIFHEKLFLGFCFCSQCQLKTWVVC